MPGFLNLIAHFLGQTLLSADGRRGELGGVRAEKDRCQRKGMWDMDISSTDAGGTCGVGNRAQEPISSIVFLSSGLAPL